MGLSAAAAQKQQPPAAVTTPPPRAAVSRIWAAAVGHPLRPVRVCMMGVVFGVMLARAGALYRR